MTSDDIYDDIRMHHRERWIKEIYIVKRCYKYIENFKLRIYEG